MNLKNILFLLFAISFYISCEEPFTPEESDEPSEIVVEGYIEAGENAAPPYVLLTKTLPFFSEISTNEFNNLFVNDAEIMVSDGSNEIQLTEICLNELSPAQQELAGELFGLDTDSLEANFCVYIDLTGAMMGEAGKTYDLTINVEGKTLTASTTIPFHVPIDTMAFEDITGQPVDTLRDLRAYLDDPAGIENYYRYFTSQNGSALNAGTQSVIDDAFFDGKYFEFILPENDLPEEEVDFNSFGTYTVGDTIQIKWACIDKTHFDFWSTLEFNAANQGPFSSYTIVASNVEGGLGVWGGYSVSYYNKIVE